MFYNFHIYNKIGFFLGEAFSIMSFRKLLPKQLVARSPLGCTHDNGSGRVLNSSRCDHEDNMHSTCPMRRVSIPPAEPHGSLKYSPPSDSETKASYPPTSAGMGK